jgi:hypothetical protein
LPPLPCLSLSSCKTSRSLTWKVTCSKWWWTRKHHQERVLVFNWPITPPPPPTHPLCKKFTYCPCLSTNGSGSGRKNMWIWIRNTDCNWESCIEWFGLLFLLDARRIRIKIRTLGSPIRIQEYPQTTKTGLINGSFWFLLLGQNKFTMWILYVYFMIIYYWRWKK